MMRRKYDWGVAFIFITGLTLAVSPRAAGQECLTDVDCDDGNLCTADTCVGNVCQSIIEPAGTVCRPSSGVCDPGETCDGLTASCPFDALSPAGTVCRASTGPCDPAETCNGLSGACPADTFVPDGTACDDGAFCTLTDVCTAGACVGSGDPCMGQACDEINDTCFDCASDAECDDGSLCTTDICVDGACQNTIEPAGTVCRLSSGQCDPEETCDGLLAACPLDAVVMDGTACDDSAFCTLTDVCTGGVCVGSGDPCAGQACDEINDTCFGCLTNADCDDGSLCTTDTCVASACQYAIEPAGTVCRPSSGVCDPIETCDGISATCPTDTLETAGTVCRASTGACDPAEICDGFFAACPADTFVPDGTLCDDGAFCTLTDVCTSGVCVGSGDPCAGQACDEISDTCGVCLPRGDSCTADDECCSGRCRGKAGNKTCKGN